MITTYEKGFDNLWLVTNTTDSPHGTSAGFSKINLRLEPTQQQAPTELLQDFRQCSYGPITTQQQAPTEPLQDFQQRFKTQVPDPNPKSHLDLKSLWK